MVAVNNDAIAPMSRMRPLRLRTVVTIGLYSIARRAMDAARSYWNLTRTAVIARRHRRTAITLHVASQVYASGRVNHSSCTCSRSTRAGLRHRTGWSVYLTLVDFFV